MSLIPIDETCVITQGQDGVLKVTLDAAHTGTSWLLTVAENPDYVDDVALPDFLVKDKEYDTASWSAVLTSSTTDGTLHVPASSVVAMTFTDDQTDLLTGAGPGRYIVDVWCVDAGNEAPVYGPVWLIVLPPARRI